MNLQDFKASLANQTPPAGIDLPLQVLWHEARGDWDTAHGLTQGSDDRTVAWVHAYLHRKEGDASNAAYWYSRAGKPVSTRSLDEEWEAIVQALL